MKEKRNEKLKVGVIGLGEVAQVTHLPILESMSDRFEIAAICDVSPRLLEVLGDRYRVHNQYTDAQALTVQQDLDVVFVLNSDEYHAECVIAAAKNKKHILIEKPMTLTLADADAIIRARDEAGIQVMVGYMRRFAPAFLRTVDEVKKLEKINYVRIRDIIGVNRLMVDQACMVHRFDDIPADLSHDKAERAKRMLSEAIGESPLALQKAYRLLCGLGSHDLSAMRELLGVPNHVIAASQWNDGKFIHATLEFNDYHAAFETGIDQQRRFDAHIEIFAEKKTLKLQYDTPYIRHLPTTLTVHETIDEAYQETVIRPTFKDPYTYELEHFYDVATGAIPPKTTPEDYKQDLKLFQQIIGAMK
ncbi:Gfo/Idh/MocA family oxidoreductase [Paenibacillus sp. PL2-23]|uniref:Gfo/Idh/MocA family protein n=1 Tax=Paenibacillus sp. PL2-23 TaxID=2100729 RepID=UPI0030F97446